MLDKIKDFYSEHAEQGELLPIVFVMGIIPLIVKQKNYMTRLDAFSWFSDEQYLIDVFHYYKRNFLIMAALLMALLLLVDFLDGSVKIKKAARCILIALAAYEALAVLSCCFSQYRWFSVHGTYGHFETIFVLLSYGLLLLYTYCMIKRERDVQAVLFLWSILLVPMILLGLSQASGHDFYNTDLGNRLIMTESFYESGGATAATFGKGRVYLSLSNPNYVGSFGALICPIMVTLCFYSKSWKGRVFYGFLASGLLFCLMGALAKTGLAALAVAFVCLVILFRRFIIRRKRSFFLVMALGSALCAGYILVRGDTLLSSIKSAFEGFEKNTTVYNLQGIETRTDGVEVAYKGKSFLVQCRLDEFGNMLFSVEDDQGGSLKLSGNKENNSYEIMDDNFKGITLTQLQHGETPIFDLNIEGKSRYFSNQTPYEGYYYLSPFGKFTKIQTAPHWGFEGYEGFASHRGYIWSRTFPLLKEFFFLGSGPDTFLMVFPQDDYVIKTRQGYESQLMSKPHNMFLQIGVQTGVPSLAAFLTIYALYMCWSLKVYWKNSMESWISAVGAAIFVGTLAYMMVGLTADSTINVAPVFWCLIGLGMSVNQLVAEKTKVE